MSLRRIALGALLAFALGLVCDFALAAWLGWRAPGVVNGATFTVPAGDSTLNLHWEHEFGRQSVECNRHGPPVSITSARAHYAATYPDAHDGSGWLGFPESAIRRADMMIPGWSARALSGSSGSLHGIQAVGFPLPSYCRAYETFAPRLPKVGDGTLFQHATDQRRAVLCIPIIRGVAVNAILWAVLWSPLVIGVPLWRRRSRRRRGHCVQCAYDLRGDFAHGCPECGWNRPSSSATPADALAPHPNLA